jgi:hypothetical protein
MHVFRLRIVSLDTIDRARRIMKGINILDSGAVHWSFPDDQLEAFALRG